MMLQLVYEEKPGLGGGEEYGCGAPAATPARPAEKPKPARKNKFSKRLHDNGVVLPREGLPIHESETKLCMAIWQSVVIQSMYDLSGKGGSAERRMARAEASSWFSEGEGDFEMVCEMANLSPAQVRKIAKTIRDNGVELTGCFNFRSVRKEYSNRVGKRNKTVKT